MWRSRYAALALKHASSRLSIAWPMDFFCLCSNNSICFYCCFCSLVPVSSFFLLFEFVRFFSLVRYPFAIILSFRLYSIGGGDPNKSRYKWHSVYPLAVFSGVVDGDDGKIRSIQYTLNTWILVFIKFICTTMWRTFSNNHELHPIGTTIDKMDFGNIDDLVYITIWLFLSCFLGEMHQNVFFSMWFSTSTRYTAHNKLNFSVPLFAAFVVIFPLYFRFVFWFVTLVASLSFPIENYTRIMIDYLSWYPNSS